MKNFYVECNSMSMSENEFSQTFCAVCKNRECTKADWAFSSWDKRILNQSERLLKPNIVLQEQSSKWENIPNIETLEYSGVVEVWGVSSKGEIAKEEIAKEEIAKEEIAKEEIQTTLTQEKKSDIKKHPTPNHFFNTPAKEILVGGNIKNQTNKDPWSIPSSNQIKIGGVFKMGGKK